MTKTPKRDVFFVPDPFDSSKGRVNLGTVYDGEGFYYKDDWDEQKEYLSLRTEQQACVRLVLSDLREDDWDNVDELPVSVGPQVVFGPIY
jgi:hypothetical protein